MRYHSSTGPGAVVAPGGKPFESLSVRLILHENTDTERVGLARREMERRLSPSLTESPLNFMITDISSSKAMRLAVDQASATGHELVIIGFGAAGWCDAAPLLADAPAPYRAAALLLIIFACSYDSEFRCGMCFKQLNNATFKTWMKGEVKYANSKGIQVSAYTLMQHNGWGEITPLAEQTLSRAGKRGPTACFATKWHAMYRQAVLDFIADVGLGGLETDGQFEGIPCADEHGDHEVHSYS